MILGPSQVPYFSRQSSCLGYHTALPWPTFLDCGFKDSLFFTAYAAYFSFSGAAVAPAGSLLVVSEQTTEPQSDSLGEGESSGSLREGDLLDRVAYGGGIPSFSAPHLVLSCFSEYG